jgi:hypothetical protein
MIENNIPLTPSLFIGSVLICTLLFNPFKKDNYSDVWQNQNWSEETKVIKNKCNCKCSCIIK